MSVAVNFQTTNPAQLNDRVTELQVAAQLDEANNLGVAEYTSAGAITVAGGTTFLKTGTAGTMTLAQPLAGAQLNGGQDGLTLEIVNLDAEAYTVTTASNGINGNKHVATSAGAIGDTLRLIAFGGTWYARIDTTGTPAWALT